MFISTQTQDSFYLKLLLFEQKPHFPPIEKAHFNPNSKVIYPKLMLFEQKPRFHRGRRLTSTQMQASFHPKLLLFEQEPHFHSNARVTATPTQRSFRPNGSSYAILKGLKTTNEWQDDGTDVLHQVAQHPRDIFWRDTLKLS